VLPPLPPELEDPPPPPPPPHPAMRKKDAATRSLFISEYQPEIVMK
jgi:hypothetical protein